MGVYYIFYFFLGENSLFYLYSGVEIEIEIEIEKEKPMSEIAQEDKKVKIELLGKENNILFNHKIRNIFPPFTRRIFFV